MNITVLSALAALMLVASLAQAEEKFDCEKSVKKQNNVIQSLTRMLMMLQLNAEESARTGGDSGIKQTRARNIGTRAYHSSTHISNAVNSNHDHSQNRLTVGMGEVVAVINGVEFRTRHNDYQMVMPSTTSSANGAIQQIPLPDVPPAVLKQKTVEGQVKEMRAWFKAFRNQHGPHRANPDHRDYWNYFKPVLCYMEAGWTQAEESIDEPFESDRHFVEAATWWELTDKVRYTGNSGTKSTKENYSFLPMKIFNMNKYGDPVFAQWNYRILCHPLKQDVPTASLRVIDDLSNRMKNGKTLEEHETSRRARFELFNWLYKNQHSWERSYRRSFLDKLMEEIPGKDNYGANLTDNSFGNVATKYDGALDEDPINVGYYHRVYKGAKGAMGGTFRNRGFSDRNIFMAKTTQSKVPSMKVTDCFKGPCQDFETKWSYAIPLEIIYLTPLYNWNPYNLTYAENGKGDKWKYNKVTANGRNGGLTKEKAYDGSRRNVFYRTPEEFFGGGGEIDRDPADTSKGTVGVLSPDGKVHKTVASGTRIMLPDIPGVGKIRTRYPISPLFNDGSQIYKEVEALKDIVLKQQTNQKMLIEKPSGHGAGSGEDQNTYVTLSMTMTHRDPPGLHTHTVSIHAMDLKDMMSSGQVHVVDTTEMNGHSHVLEIKYNAGAPHPWWIQSCDGDAKCWDGHQDFLVRVD